MRLVTVLLRFPPLYDNDIGAQEGWGMDLHVPKEPIADLLESNHLQTAL